MSKPIFYRQCELNKETTSEVVWIPEVHARKGKILKVRENNLWDDGWKVVKVGEIRLEEKYLPDSHKEIKSHRNKTGDSMPKVKNER